MLDHQLTDLGVILRSRSGVNLVRAIIDVGVDKRWRDTFLGYVILVILINAFICV